MEIVRSLIETNVVSPVFALSESEARYGSQHLAQIRPILPPYDMKMGIAATFSIPPIIPLSVVLKQLTATNNGPNNRLSHLQVASLKRQVCGLCFLYLHESVTTVVSIATGDDASDYQIESVTFQPGSNVEPLPGLFIVTPTTRITVLNLEDVIPIKSSFPDNLTIVESAACDVLRRTIKVLNQNEDADIPRCFLLAGAPGVGKTHAVRSAVQASHAQPIFFKSLLGSDVMALSGTATTAGLCLEKHFIHLQNKSAKQICVIFLDEFDALISLNSPMAVLTHQLDELASRFKRIVVVAATNRIESVPQSLRRAGRFEQELIIQHPSFTQRKRILSALITDEALCIEDIAEMTIGFVPADLYALVRYARVLGLSNTQSLEVNVQNAMKRVGASTLRDSSLSKPPEATWDCVAGDAGGAKTALIQAIEWPRTKKHKFQCLGLDPPRGILLHGPPGCAKTTLARAAAGSQNIAFISLSPADVFASSYVGDAESIVRRAFASARATAPCILFFDEIDSILGSENGGGHQMNRASGGASPESRVLSTFLNETDGLTSIASDRVLVIGATNRPSTLDAALLRPGRFDKVIFVPPPDFDGRVAIIKKQVQQLTSEEKDEFDVQRLASDEISGNLTGAEIEGAFREFAGQHLLELLATSDSQPKRMDVANLERLLKAVCPLISTPGVMEEFLAFERHRLHS